MIRGHLRQHSETLPPPGNVYGLPGATSTLIFMKYLDSVISHSIEEAA